MDLYQHAFRLARQNRTSELKDVIQASPRLLWTTTVSQRGRSMHGLVDDVVRIRAVNHDTVMFLVDAFVGHMRGGNAVCAALSPHLYSGLCSDHHSWDTICMDAVCKLATSCVAGLEGADRATFLRVSRLRWAQTTMSMVSFNARYMAIHNSVFMVAPECRSSHRLFITLQHGNVICELCEASTEELPPQVVVSIAMMFGVFHVWRATGMHIPAIDQATKRIRALMDGAISRFPSENVRDSVTIECANSILVRFGSAAVPRHLRRASARRLMGSGVPSPIYRFSDSYSVITDSRFRMNLSALSLLASSSPRTMRHPTDQGNNAFHICAGKYGPCRCTYENATLFTHFMAVFERASPRDMLQLNCRSRSALTTLINSVWRCSRTASCRRIILDVRVAELLALPNMAKTCAEAPDHIARYAVQLLYTGGLRRAALAFAGHSLQRPGARLGWHNSIFNMAGAYKEKKDRLFYQKMTMLGVFDPVAVTRRHSAVFSPFANIPLEMWWMGAPHRDIVRAILACTSRPGLPFLPKEMVLHILSFVRCVDIGHWSSCPSTGMIAAAPKKSF